MAQLDPNIPLAAGENQWKPFDFLGSTLKSQAIQGNQLSLEAAQEQRAEREQLKQELQHYDFSTPAGRSAAFIDIMKINPETGMKLIKQDRDIRAKEAQTRKFLSERDAKDLSNAKTKSDMLAQLLREPLSIYKQAVDSNKSEDEARKLAQGAYVEAWARASQAHFPDGSPMFSEQDLGGLGPQFDPAKTMGLVSSSGVYGKWLDQELKLRQENRLESKVESGGETLYDSNGGLLGTRGRDAYGNIVERDAQGKPMRPGSLKGFTRAELAKKLSEGAGDKGWQLKIGEDPDTGEKTWVRINTKTGAVIPVKSDLQPPMTSSGGQRAIRPALVQATGRNAIARLDELEKKFGAPSVSLAFGVHPEGPLSRTGMMIYRKLGMSNDQQAIDAMATSIIDEATPVFTGGLRSSDAFRKFLMTQLPQPGDSNETAKIKWDLIRKNINGTLDTFNKMFRTNPKYWTNPNIPPPNSSPAAMGAESAQGHDNTAAYISEITKELQRSDLSVSQRRALEDEYDKLAATASSKERGGARVAAAPPAKEGVPGGAPGGPPAAPAAPVRPAPTAAAVTPSGPRTGEGRIGGPEFHRVAPPEAPKEGDQARSKTGRPIVFRNGRWEYD